MRRILAAAACVAAVALAGTSGCQSSAAGTGDAEATPGTGHSMTIDQRKAYEAHLAEILPPVKSFSDWQAKTGELPPDFAALPRSNELPDPLKFLNGRPVKTAADWQARRKEIIALEEKYDIGSIPPKPKLDSVTVLDPAAVEAAATQAAAARGAAGGGPGRGRGGAAGRGGVAGRGGFAGRGFGGFGRGAAAAPGSVTKMVDLKYGPVINGEQITTRVTLRIPPGKGPFPVMIAGGADVTARGYISCTFPGSVDAPPDVARFYPDYDWGSMARMAWVTQMVVDYLYTLPEVDKSKIAITGYSRNGKMALITTALDQRITGCIAGSTGVGGIYTWRDGSERNGSESIESTTRSFPLWFTPRLRYFSGREDRLPVDGNLWLALCAPRAVIALWGDNDEVSQSWGMEHSVKSGQTVYAFLGKPNALGMMHIPGYHGANDVDRSFEFLNIQFGRAKGTWTDDWMFPWDYDKWHAQVKGPVARPGGAARSAIDGVTNVADWEKRKAGVLAAVNTMLGSESTLAHPFALPKLRDPNEPAAAPRGGGFGRGGAGGFGGRGGRGGRGGAAAETAAPEPAPAAPSAAPSHFTLSEDIRNKAKGPSYGWPQQEAANVTSRKLAFTGAAGNTIVADLYIPKSAAPGTKLPVVIWEHGYFYSLGYSWVYNSYVHPILALANSGYAVLAYDQSGFGSRISEAAPFYNRYPHWSQLGHMIGDTEAAIDALGRDDQIDASRLYLYGFSMGGDIALYTAALDPRVKGVVAISAFTPMRTDTADKGTGGIARLFRDKDILPNLGIYEGHEASIPYDYDDLIAAIAPRPVYIVSPTLDRSTTPADVHNAVEHARKIFALYNASDKLAIDEPWDYSRLPDPIQERAINWMKTNMK